MMGYCSYCPAKTERICGRTVGLLSCQIAVAEMHISRPLPVCHVSCCSFDNMDMCVRPQRLQVVTSLFGEISVESIFGNMMIDSETYSARLLSSPSRYSPKSCPFGMAGITNSLKLI